MQEFENNNSTDLSFPDATIADSKKDEKYHKEFVMAIAKEALNRSADQSRKMIAECFDFYNGVQSSDEFEFVQQAEDGDVLPATWINYNKIKTKIDLQMGELIRKGYRLKIRAVNQEAKIRKLNEKENSRVDLRMMGVGKELEQMNGLPLGMPQLPFEDEEGLEDYYQNEHEEKGEFLMKKALEYVLRKLDFEYQRLAMFRNLLITNRVIVRCEVRNGFPYFKCIDPRNFIFDESATDDFLSDATYYGEYEYVSLGEAAEAFGLSRKELKASYKAFQEGQFSTDEAVRQQYALHSSEFPLYKKEERELKVLVVRAAWQDIKHYNHKESTDKHGNTHLKEVPGNKKGADILKTELKIWRQATLIGGKILKEWGEMKNQVRSLDNLSETRPPYIVLIPNYLNGQSVSVVQQLKGLQKFKDLTMFNLQLTMSRAGAKGFVFDVSQVPDGWDVHTVIKYLKTVGIAFIDSKKDGIPSNFNQFGSIDMTLSSSVSQYLEISMMIDREMDAVSGINEARQGMVQSSSQAVGVTQSALLQSSLSTELRFELFKQFINKLLNNQAGLIKITWEDPEKYAPVISEVGFDFISEPVDLDLDDFDVDVQSLPPIAEDRQMFQGMIQAALQAGAIDFEMAIDLLLENDLDTAVRKFKKNLKKQREEQQAMQQMQQQAEQQAMAEQEQMRLQAEQQNMAAQGQMKMQEIDKSKQWDKDITQVKSRADLLKILTKGKMDMAQNLYK